MPKRMTVVFVEPAEGTPQPEYYEWDGQPPQTPAKGWHERVDFGVVDRDAAKDAGVLLVLIANEDGE